MSIDILQIKQLSNPFSFGKDLTTPFNGNLPFYCYGKSSINSSLPVYSAGKISVNSNLSGYTTGKGSSNQGINLFTSGKNHSQDGSLVFYTIGYDPHPTSSLPMFCYVSGVGLFSGNINMFARVKEGASLNFFCQGPGVPQNSSLMMFSTGILGQSGSLVMSCPIGKGNTINSLPMYTRGW